MMGRIIVLKYIPIFFFVSRIICSIAENKEKNSNFIEEIVRRHPLDLTISSVEKGFRLYRDKNDLPIENESIVGKHCFRNNYPYDNAFFEFKVDCFEIVAKSKIYNRKIQNCTYGIVTSPDYNYTSGMDRFCELCHTSNIINSIYVFYGENFKVDGYKPIIKQINGGKYDGFVINTMYSKINNERLFLCIFDPLKKRIDLVIRKTDLAELENAKTSFLDIKDKTNHIYEFLNLSSRTSEDLPYKLKLKDEEVWIESLEANSLDLIEKKTVETKESMIMSEIKRMKTYWNNTKKYERYDAKNNMGIKFYLFLWLEEDKIDGIRDLNLKTRIPLIKKEIIDDIVRQDKIKNGFYTFSKALDNMDRNTVSREKMQKFFLEEQIADSEKKKRNYVRTLSLLLVICVIIMLIRRFINISIDIYKHIDKFD